MGDPRQLHYLNLVELVLTVSTDNELDPPSAPEVQDTDSLIPLNEADRRAATSDFEMTEIASLLVVA